MGGYFGFDGRARRRTYWLAYVLPTVVVCLGAGVFDYRNGDMDGGLGPAGLLAALACALPFLAGTVKRCHDRGRSGWWLLVCAVPVVGLAWCVVELGFLRGTWRANEYGGDPLSTRWAAVA